MNNPICRQCCKREVDDDRADWATPVCLVCLPPPKPLPVHYTPSMLTPTSIAASVADHFGPADGCSIRKKVERELAERIERTIEAARREAFEEAARVVEEHRPAKLTPALFKSAAIVLAAAIRERGGA